MSQGSDIFLPKPQIALNLGITGHRLNGLRNNKPAIVNDALHSVYAMLLHSVEALRKEVCGTIYADKPPIFRVVSALAEGADRLASDAAPPEWHIAAVLPMPRDEYARDFEQSADEPSSKAEFLRLLARAESVTELPLLDERDVGSSDARAEHYHALGIFLIRQIDLLIAVWDGQAARGPGGTGDVVALAIQRKTPVIWIDPENASPPRILYSLNSSGVHTCHPFDNSSCAALIKGILAPPAIRKRRTHGHGEEAADPGSITRMSTLPEYFAAPWPKHLFLPFAYNLLRAVSGVGRWRWPISYGAFADFAKGWGKSFESMAEAPERGFSERLNSVLMPRSVWADVLAWRYGMIYRSAYITIFLLAGLSVPVGLCYLYFLESPSILGIKAIFVCIELVIIATIVMLVRQGVKRNWHGAWLETRELAELLRQGKWLSRVGGLREFLSPTGGEESVPAWYARATFREIGLPHGLLDTEYLRQVLTATSSFEIAEQRGYHFANAVNLGKIQNFLHRKGDACFYATIGFLFFYLLAWAIDHISIAALAAEPEKALPHGGTATHSHGLLHELLEYWIKPTVSIAAAGLPALGAALSGIRAQGDFEGFAERSRATHAALAEIEGRIDTLLDSGVTISVDAATEVLMMTTYIMTQDVNAWRQLYYAKRLVLPA